MVDSPPVVSWFSPKVTCVKEPVVGSIVVVVLVLSTDSLVVLVVSTGALDVMVVSMGDVVFKVVSADALIDVFKLVAVVRSLVVKTVETSY